MGNIVIFEKNKIDVDAPNVTITATDVSATDDGQDFVSLLRNRRNDSGYGTTGSLDSYNTTLEIDTADEYEVSDIILVGHNLKSYTLKYWNGLAWTDFSTAVNVTNNLAPVTWHQFNAVTSSQFQLICTGTQTPNSDKLIAQIIITKKIGQFECQPFVRKPKQDRGRKVRKMLSGRTNVTRALGATSFSYQFPKNINGADMLIIDRMFESVNGFLVWNCGGSTEQFPMVVQGFRLQDIYLMSCANDFDGEWNDGHFAHGQATEISLVESRT